MRYLSVCSGIEAATVAWHPLGWTPVLFSEIERFPRAALVRARALGTLRLDWATREPRGLFRRLMVAKARGGTAGTFQWRVR